MHDQTSTERCSAQLLQLSQPAEQRELQSDVELLELYVRAQDRMAMETLIKRYAPLVASVCSLTVDDCATAEDAFQATFLILLRQANKIRRRASLAAWLHGVAYRCACRLRKQKRERARQEIGEAAMALQQFAPDPLTALAHKLNLEALDRELEGLSDQLRGPLVEHYLLGFTAPQIADRMELSVSAVEGRLRRGRRVLRARLAQRGISLSVLAAGSGLFQEHLAAAQATSLTTQFLEVYLPASVPGGGSAATQPHTSSQVSSLVRGETTMLGTPSLKAAAAAGLLLAGGTLFALNAGGGDSARGNSPFDQNHLTLPALPAEHSVVAQFAPSTATAPAASAATAQASAAVDSAKDQSVEWQRPESAEGAEPSWLAGGRSSVEALEQNRQVLAMKLDFKFEQTPLQEVARWLSEQTDTPFYMDSTEIELGGLADVDTPVTAAGNASVREIIRLIGDPLQMTYLVEESGIVITTKDHANESPSLRYYDLAYILPNPANVDALVNTIYTSVDPLGWYRQGGNSSISLVGSMMVVSAPDSVHQKIEMVLVNIAKMNPHNMERTTDPMGTSGWMGGGMGGMGGGMGGMGGGMGGMGGGMGGMGGGMGGR